ncbi:MAG: IS110 family transposase [Actinobacteria bacterium]|nr:MAG: IS110 family transposase [Actinomycetota bacterium]
MRHCLLLEAEVGEGVVAVPVAHDFSSPKKLVSYVGLDPRVRQSGEGPARRGHISKQGSSEARHMLCEAAWVAVRGPPARGAPSMSACAPAGEHRSRSSPPRGSSACCSGICSRVNRTTPSGGRR